MKKALNNLIDTLSEFLAYRKGLFLMISLLIIVANLDLQFIPGSGWLAQSNLLLHIGIVLAVLGVLLAWAL